MTQQILMFFYNVMSAQIGVNAQILSALSQGSSVSSQYIKLIEDTGKKFFGIKEKEITKQQFNILDAFKASLQKNTLTVVPKPTSRDRQIYAQNTFNIIRRKKGDEN